MEKNPVAKKDLAKCLLLSLFILSVIFFRQYFGRRTTIAFCDVGQGDAAYIRIKNRIDIIVDTGPNNKILSCLGRYMPFYDRKIELAIISHGQKDHIGGLKEIQNRYRVEKILSPKSASQGDALQILSDKISILWPPKNKAAADENSDSLIFLLQEDRFKVLFTGDAPAGVLNKLSVRNIDILKIPHHGSRNGLSRSFLELAHPRLAVISVGAKNTYGHPAKEVIDALQALKIKIKRTDKEGDIVLKLN